MRNNHPAWTLASLGALLIAALAAAGDLVLAQGSSSTLLVALRSNKDKGALAFVDPATGKIMAQVPTGKDPHGVTAAPDGKTAYVVNTSGADGNSLSIIDIATKKETRRVQLGPGSRPHDVSVAGGKVYFTAQGYRAIGRYDPAKNTLEWFGLGHPGPHMMVVSKDGNTIYAANPRARNISIIEGISTPDWKVTVVPVGGEGEGIDLTADGKELWTANGEEGGGVSIVDLATKKVTTISLRAKHTNRLQITPDGKYVVVLDREAGDLIVMDRVARKEVKRMKPGSAPGVVIDFGDIASAPDSSKTYVTVFSKEPGNNYIAVLDLKTLAVTTKFETPIAADEMAWVK